MFEEITFSIILIYLKISRMYVIFSHKKLLRTSLPVLYFHSDFKKLVLLLLIQPLAEMPLFSYFCVPK